MMIIGLVAFVIVAAVKLLFFSDKVVKKVYEPDVNLFTNTGIDRNERLISNMIADLDRHQKEIRDLQYHSPLIIKVDNGVEACLSYLGLKVKDRVTGFKGVVVSICFDLYGCKQALLNPGKDKDGKLQDSQWFDTNRIEIESLHPVMDRPVFVVEKGPEEKPSTNKV